jgi:PAS domain-containing protein
MLGYELQEIIGLDVSHIFLPEDRDRVLASFRQGQESRIEYRMLCEDGCAIVVEARLECASLNSENVVLTIWKNALLR